MLKCSLFIQVPCNCKRDLQIHHSRFIPLLFFMEKIPLLLSLILMSRMKKQVARRWASLTAPTPSSFDKDPRSISSLLRYHDHPCSAAAAAIGRHAGRPRNSTILKWRLETGRRG